MGRGEREVDCIRNTHIHIHRTSKLSVKVHVKARSGKSGGQKQTVKNTPMHDFYTQKDKLQVASKQACWRQSVAM